MKSCTKCGESKAFEEFPPNLRMKDGRGSWCRECARAQRRDWTKRNPAHSSHRYLANRSAELERRREMRERPEAKAKRRAEGRSYYLQNKERIAAKKRAKRQSDLEATRAADRAKNEKLARDPRRLDYKRRANGKRRARLLKLPSEHIEPAEVFERDSGICGICKLAVDPGDWHMDHIVPLAAGGSHVYENVQVSHPRCNTSKGSRLAA